MPIMTNEDVLKQFRKLALASSFLFFAGMLLAAISVLLTFSLIGSTDDDDRERITIIEVTATTAMIIIAASILPEIAIDIRVGRPVARGRYGKDGWVAVYSLQHFLFFSGAILQGYAFLPNSTVEESSLFLIPALLWTVSAALTVASTGCCCGSNFRDSAYQTANAIFLAMSLAMCMGSQFLCGQCFLGAFVYGIVPFVGCAIGIVYLIRDCRLTTSTTISTGAVVAEEIPVDKA